MGVREVEAALAELQEGAQVRVRLADGSDQVATYVDGELVAAETGEHISVEQVARVLIDIRTDAPE